MTADQAWDLFVFARNQVQDPSEKIKLNQKMLGAVESDEQRRARICALLDSKPRYQIKTKPKKK